MAFMTDEEFLEALREYQGLLGSSKYQTLKTQSEAALSVMASKIGRPEEERKAAYRALAEASGKLRDEDLLSGILDLRGRLQDEELASVRMWALKDKNPFSEVPPLTKETLALSKEALGLYSCQSEV